MKEINLREMNNPLSYVTDGIMVEMSSLEDDEEDEENCSFTQNPLKPCVMCKSKVTIDYLENQRYRIYCGYCGQWFEFNAPSQMAAEFIYNKIIAVDGDTNDT